MTRNALAIIAIFLCTTAGWAILGSTIFARTYAAGSDLEPRVAASWGGRHQQAAPVATASWTVPKKVQENVNGKTVEKTVDENFSAVLPLERSRIKVAFDLEQRRKGLLWFPTYRVALNGDYSFRNTTPADQVSIKLVFPAAEAIYDDLVFRVDGQAVPLNTVAGAGSVTVRDKVPGSLIVFETGYKSQGLSTWHYTFGENVVQVRDFLLEMTTGFDAIDFPLGTVSPTIKTRTAEGWQLQWKYNHLVTGYRIGMEMPEKLQPGPVAGRISYFAPVSLLFFFFLMFIITTMKKINLHPMHYFFQATSFFAFHLLLAYLVDHISVHAAFVICSIVSIFLVVSYLRIVVGPRFALREAALAQLVYLVGFSYAFFFKGYTGLAVTVGAILSLFLVMQMTARVDWSRRTDAPPQPGR